jgi:hypothetical protein
MGGYGSGRTGGRPTIERSSALVLCVHDVTRPVRDAVRARGGLEPGERAEATCTWSWRWEGEPWAAVDVRLWLGRAEGAATLRYDIDHLTRSTGPQVQTVALETTPGTLGGQCWWWICPATGRRVLKLYLPNGGVRFLSRTAYRLVYQSQREERDERARRRMRNLCRRLGGDYDEVAGTWPEKPKWMRWHTYNALCDRLDADAGVLDAELDLALRRFAVRFGFEH